MRRELSRQSSKRAHCCALWVCRILAVAYCAHAPQVGARLRVRVRPAIAITGPLEARAFIVVGGAVSRSAVAVVPEPDGAFLVEASRLELFPEAARGEAQLVLVIARPGRMLGEEALRKQLVNGPQSPSDDKAPVRVLPVKVRLVPG